MRAGLFKNAEVIADLAERGTDVLERGAERRRQDGGGGLGMGFGLGIGLLLGAGLMYLLDPDRGKTRQAYARDKAIRARHEAERIANRATARAEDLRNRAQGRMIETQKTLEGEDVPDDVLVDRVRSQIGRCIDHTRNVLVTAFNGRVTLRGPILEREVEPLLSCVRDVRGVKDVINQLDVHQTPGNTPSLQESRPTQG
jgi:osmotically-inducible protein OsmY